MGMLGMHGTQYANYAVSKADLLIAVGARFDDRVTGKLQTFAPEATIIHIDIDPAEISKNVAVDVPIVGDAKTVLAALLAELKKLELSPDRHLPWMEQVETWKKNHPLVVRETPRTARSCPSRRCSTIWELTGGDAIVCTEVGQNQMWAAQHYLARHPRHFISSGGLGTMGFGFPAAIGAQVACPDKLVIDIAGDGSFQMTLQELATAVQLRPAGEGLHPQQPVSGHGAAVAGALLEQALQLTPAWTCQPDFVKLAEAYGAEGYRAEQARGAGGGAARGLWPATARRSSTSASSARPTCSP